MPVMPAPATRTAPILLELLEANADAPEVEARWTSDEWFGVSMLGTDPQVVEQLGGADD